MTSGLSVKNDLLSIHKSIRQIRPSVRHSFVRSLVNSFIINQSFIHLFIYLFIYVTAIALLFETGGISTAVGTYFPENDKIVFSGAEVLWRGIFTLRIPLLEKVIKELEQSELNCFHSVFALGGKPPSDSKLVIYEIQYISTPLFCVIVILASGGILLALYFLWFNVVKRKHRYVRHSSCDVHKNVSVALRNLQRFLSFCASTV